MRRIGKSTFTEIYFWGCNPGFVPTSDGVVMIDSPQQPIDAMRWRERLLEHGPIRHLINTEPHGDHILGNAYFPTAEVIGQIKLKENFDRYLVAGGTMAERVERTKTADPDSVWLMNHPDYPPRPPTRTFTESLVLEVGHHSFHCLHLPGHTAAQTAVFIPQEGVVFTGDNVFRGCKTFIQEGDPWAWLQALEAIDKLDVETIVPGHGEPCTKAYLKTQGQIIANWIGLTESFVDRGLSEEEAMTQPIDVRGTLDPYPIGQRLFAIEEALNGRNIGNIYRQIVARRRTTEDGRRSVLRS
jgi:cyclase